MRRHRMSRHQSKGVFRRGASNIHPKNTGSSGSTYSMRGGIRL